VRWEDGFAAGNGRHGALAWGQARDERVVISHHALVMPNAGTGRLPPRLAGQLPALRALLLAGDSAGALRLSCAGWQEWFPRAFHPALAVTLRAPGEGAVTGYRRAVDFRTGLLTTTWSDTAGHWRRSCFVSRPRDLVVLRLQLPPGTPACVEVSHDVRLPGAPPDLAVRWLAPVPAGSGLLLPLQVDYPDPSGGASDQVGGYSCVTQIVAPGGTCEADGPLAQIRGATEVMLLIRVTADPPRGEASRECDDGDKRMSRLSHPRQTRSAGVAVISTGVADQVPPPPPPAPSWWGGRSVGGGGDHDALLVEHARVHRACLGRVRLDLRAPERDRRLAVEELLARQAAQPDRPVAALLEKLFDSGRYLLLSASGLLPPRLTGLWQGDWHAAWSGAIVSNANLNLQLAGAVTTDVPAAVHALAGMIETQLPDWRLNAARLYGARGVFAPASSDGFRGVACHFAPSYPHHLWTAGADWLAAVLLDYAHAAGDEAFLRERVLPLLIEIATFYEDLLAGTDGGAVRGTVMFVPSYSPENRPGGWWSPAAINATMDIAAARHALGAAADVCTRLGLEQGPGEGVQRWLALRERLPHYRVNADGALAEWAWPETGPPLADRYGHRHLSHLYPVWPLHDITVGTGPPPGEPPLAEPRLAGAALAEPPVAEPPLAEPPLAGAALAEPPLAGAALRALELRGAENGSAHGLLHAGLAAARLRDAALAGERLAVITSGYFFRGLMSGHYRGPDVYNADTACCLPGLLAELLVDSAAPGAGAPGWVELLPAVPQYLPAGQVTGLRTLTGVRVDLTWDLPAARARAALHSQVDQHIGLVCRRAADCRSAAVVARPGPRTWRLALPAGAEVPVELEAVA
jgi:hypothetical protein